MVYVFPYYLKLNNRKSLVLTDDDWLCVSNPNPPTPWLIASIQNSNIFSEEYLIRTNFVSTEDKERFHHVIQFCTKFLVRVFCYAFLRHMLNDQKQWMKLA